MRAARRPPNLLLAILAAVAAPLAGCVASQPTHRYFQPTADQVGPYANTFGEAVVPRHGRVVVQGDDLAYGLARGRSRHDINGADVGQAATTISQSLRQVVGREVQVENRGYPGDTVAASAARWGGSSAANLMILSYGYGDLQAHTPPAVFAAQLKLMIEAAHAQGATVFIVLSAPSSDPLTNSELNLYRFQAQIVANAEGVEVFDPTASMTRIKVAPWKAVAQRPSVYEAIAGDIAPYIKIVDDRG